MKQDEKDEIDASEDDEGEDDAEEETEKPGKQPEAKKPPLDKAAIYAISKIKEYLSSVASKDGLFAKKYDPTDERMAECWSYISGEVRSSKRSFLRSDEILAMSFEFFNDGLKPKDGGSYAHGKVMAENDAEDSEIESASRLTEEEKREAREKAIAKFSVDVMAEEERKRKIAEERASAKAKKEKDLAAEKKEEAAKRNGAEQLSLFPM